MFKGSVSWSGLTDKLKQGGADDDLIVRVIDFIRSDGLTDVDRRMIRAVLALNPVAAVKVLREKL